MKPAIAKRWYEALKSGKFKQTNNALQRTEPMSDGPAGHCCLGVLCELAVEDGAVTKGPSPRFGALTRYGVMEGLLPPEVIVWAGLASDDANPRLIGPNGLSNTATTWNDTKMLDFDGIADAVKRTFMSPEPGDKVLLPIGSWYKGRFVDRDRQVEGTVVRVNDELGTALIRTDHGQKPNGCQTEQHVWRDLSEIELV